MHNPPLSRFSQKWLTCLVILSNDTDVFVIAMHFVDHFRSFGLVELWFRAGKKDQIRYIPLHVLADSIGPPMCNVLPAVHALTGCDVTSKFGTKLAALKAGSTALLSDFGRSEYTLHDVQGSAENYLVKVLSQGNNYGVPVESLEELRYQMYHQRKTVTILDLPPTSHAAKGHILRAFCATHTQIYCLENVSLDPLQYGFKMHEGALEPDTYSRPLPEHMVINCNCIRCASSCCPCRENGLPCCAFCKCQSNDQPCKNPNGVVAQ